MEERHYKIREDLSIEFEGRKLYRIEALKDFPHRDVKKGDIGGYVEDYNNLSGNAWIGGDSKVFGDARVYGNAWVSRNAQVSGNADVFGNAQVSGNAKVCGNSCVFCNAQVWGDAQVRDTAWVFGDARVFGNAQVYGNAQVRGDARVSVNAQVYGDARVNGNAQVYGNARALGNSQAAGNADVCTGDITEPGDVKNITGEKYNITILPNHIQIGCQLHTKKEWWNFKDHEILEMDGKEGLKWWKKWKPILMAMCNTEE